MYGGLDYTSRWALARLIGADLGIGVSALHRLDQRRIREWLTAHPDWPRRVMLIRAGYWRQAKRRQRSRVARPDIPPLPPESQHTQPIPTGMVQGALF